PTGAGGSKRPPFSRKRVCPREGREDVQGSGGRSARPLERARGSSALGSRLLTPGLMVVKIVRDELIEVFGASAAQDLLLGSRGLAGGTVPPRRPGMGGEAGCREIRPGLANAPVVSNNPAHNPAFGCPCRRVSVYHRCHGGIPEK